MTGAFFNGALMMACAVAALFFLKFWRRTRDRLFLFFSGAFWIFAAHWLALGMLNLPENARYEPYIARLAAFLVIIAGIIDKNRSR